MRRRVITRPLARAEAVAISAYLADKRPALDQRFLVPLAGTIDWLSDNPGAGSPKHILSRRLPGLRTWPVSGFKSHLVYYRIEEPDLIVLAVFHGSRDARRGLRGRS